MDCGCVADDGGALFPVTEFCPLHAHAAEMLGALKWCSENLSGWIGATERSKLSELIAEALGEKSKDGS